jgi:hypothetical protein
MLKDKILTVNCSFLTFRNKRIAMFGPKDIKTIYAWAMGQGQSQKKKDQRVNTKN